MLRSARWLCMRSALVLAPVVTILSIVAIALYKINADDRIGCKFDGKGPYAVVIGDSIAEGHPSRHGRLHPTRDTLYDKINEKLYLMRVAGRLKPAGEFRIDDNYGNDNGQLPGELSLRWGIPVLNHGIGNNTSVDVRKRWNRDALAMKSDPKDGLGNVTAPFVGRKPAVIYVHVGINDIVLDHPIDLIKSNFSFFARSAREIGATLYVSTIGSSADAVKITDARADRIIAVNEWMRDELQRDFDNVIVVDYLNWASNGTGNPRVTIPELFDDNVHPNRSGYEHLSDFIAQRYKKPNVLNKKCLQEITSYS